MLHKHGSAVCYATNNCVSVLLLSLVSNYLATSRWLSLASLASLLRLGVGTAVWWGWARAAFPALEAATGRSLELSTGLREISRCPEKAL